MAQPDSVRRRVVVIPALQMTVEAMSVGGASHPAFFLQAPQTTPLQACWQGSAYQLLPCAALSSEISPQKRIESLLAVVDHHVLAVLDGKPVLMLMPAVLAGHQAFAEHWLGRGGRIALRQGEQIYPYFVGSASLALCLARLQRLLQHYSHIWLLALDSPLPTEAGQVCTEGYLLIRASLSQECGLRCTWHGVSQQRRHFHPDAGIASLAETLGKHDSGQINALVCDPFEGLISVRQFGSLWSALDTAEANVQVQIPLLPWGRLGSLASLLKAWLIAQQLPLCEMPNGASVLQIDLAEQGWCGGVLWHAAKGNDSI
ncbi:hypothetical protein WH50_20865 [Pokkaliibacter plantistimulans]|uniref:Beta-ketoacyl synthase N-terminal domain-containing protein n=1 Tax=Pokkaliibacter plantistimulans TaxID=1635171 RepID=A0ABX5LTE7_9GAMM|nr:hypothetical protein WH50_20865 [Pokkaliibacter plantistimulans]